MAWKIVFIFKDEIRKAALETLYGIKVLIPLYVKMIVVLKIQDTRKIIPALRW